MEDAFAPEEELEESVDYGEDLDDIPPQHTVPNGEYNLQITGLKRGHSKNDPSWAYTMAYFDILGDADAKTVIHVMMDPKDGDTEKQRKQRLREIGDFRRAFDIPRAGEVRLSEYIGQTGWAVLSEEEDKQYGLQNKVKSFIIPKS